MIIDIYLHNLSALGFIISIRLGFHCFLIDRGFIYFFFKTIVLNYCTSIYVHRVHSVTPKLHFKGVSVDFIRDLLVYVYAFHLNVFSKACAQGKVFGRNFPSRNKKKS